MKRREDERRKGEVERKEEERRGLVLEEKREGLAKRQVVKGRKEEEEW